jgi:hypothetical protein
MATKVTGTGNSYRHSSRCVECFARTDQHRRHVHFLKFPNEAALGGHLREQYGELAETDGTIGAILSWRESIKERYSGMVDEFGMPLPVWLAWICAQYGQGGTKRGV